MEAVFTYPVKSFKYQDKKVFPSGKLYDGCRELSVIVGDLDKIFNS
jgi:hypothetical protein